MPDSPATLQPANDPMRLDGKVIVMTGAAGIIGRSAVQCFLDAGAKVLALDRSEEALNSAWPQAGDALWRLPCNIADPDSLDGAAALLKNRWGIADALFNNAATKSENFFDPFESFPLGDWNEVMQVNLTGAMLAAQRFGAPMAERGRGCIINTLSIYGIVAPDQRIYDGSEYLGRAINTPAIYAASKAGLWGLTQYLATYWGPKGVRVNAITPGGVFSGQNDTFVSRYSAKVPLGRMAQPQDMANGMRFLASDAAQYLNGHNLVIDGGWTTW
jgi:NAD(P)-dependent dehydrogenase (short-subunit alcohol dehydrogenase family)